MNASLLTADAGTHLKVVVIALLAGILMVWIGIAARVVSDPTPSATRKHEMPISKPVVRPSHPWAGV